MRIALATSELSEPNTDDALLIDALASLGLAAEPTDWQGSGPWDRYDLVVVRSTWNYQDHHAAYLRWIDLVAAETRLVNPPEVMKPNTVKTYLRVLADRGIPVVPTRWITGADHDGLFDGRDVIVKPSVGASGSGLRRFTTSEGIREHVESLLPLGEVMIQPFLPSIADVGETSVVFIGGRFTHAVQKAAKPGEFRVQSEFGGAERLGTPDPATISIAERAIDALCDDPEALAYARVDLVYDEEGAPLVGEVELVEPGLFLWLNPDAAQQLARHLASHLRHVQDHPP